MHRTCCVSFHYQGAEYSNTAMGFSLFDVAANALEFFCAPHWKGPRPQRNTVLDVTILGDDLRHRVLAGRVERWAFERRTAAKVRTTRESRNQNRDKRPGFRRHS